MSSENEYTYATRFADRLRAESEPVPCSVETKLRLMAELTPDELEEYRRRAYDAPPQYSFYSGQKLPLHPSLQASAFGRHYFVW